MARTNKSGLRLDADFTEDTVGFALESFLAFLSFPRLKFSIEPFSRNRERWLGADARLSGHIAGFKPFYMQFKRPSAYPDTSKATIITDRKSLGLIVSPRSLYFGLREKQPAHWDYQHNILLRLRERLLKKNAGDAAYVCPLFLDRSVYRFHVHLAGLRGWPFFWRHAPWELEDVLINAPGGTVNFNAVPVLREHISIPPHIKVASAKHSYSFTEAGTDLCFHSPTALPEGAVTFADFLNKVIGRMGSEDGFIPTQKAAAALHDYFGSEEGGGGSLLPPNLNGDERGFGGWLQWGDYLRSEFQIEQFALVRWET